MCEWKEYKLGELIITNALTINKKYPYTEIQYLDTGSITCNKIESYQYYNIEDAPSRAKRLVKEEDIIYSLVRPNQLHYGFIKFPQKNLVVSTGFVTITCKKEVLNPKFLYYYLTQNSVIEYLHTIAEASTSAYPSLKTIDIESLDIEIPPLEEQKCIALIISSLDDKIDLLHQENKTLESMAETLFRKWFIEEVRHEVSLGDVVETTSGGTPSRKCEEYYQNGIIDWVKSKELNRSFLLKTEEKITVEAVENSSAKFLPANSVLIAMYGATVGEYAIIAKEMTCNQAVCALKPNDNYPYTYLYLWAKFMQDEFLNLACGAAQQNISQVLIKQQPVCSDVNAVKQFHSIVEPFFEKLKQNEVQLSSLTYSGAYPFTFRQLIRV